MLGLVDNLVTEQFRHQIERALILPHDHRHAVQSANGSVALNGSAPGRAVIVTARDQLEAKP